MLLQRINCKKFLTNMNIKSVLKKYDKNKLTIASLGSHSALDIAYGAKKQGFNTLIVTQKGRDKTYSEYYKTNEKTETGCVDETLPLNNFKDLLLEIGRES